MVKYSEQTHKDLHLYLVFGVCNLEQFTVLKSGKLPNFSNDIDISYGILAESHFVSITYNKKTLTEICACTQGNFDGSLLISARPTQEGQNFNVYLDQPLYSFKSSIHSGIIELPDESYNTMLYVFPDIDGVKRNAFTSVSISQVDDKIQIDSIHTYPNENIFVKTNSQIKL